jgi:hypothetical protein
MTVKSANAPSASSGPANSAREPPPAPADAIGNPMTAPLDNRPIV